MEVKASRKWSSRWQVWNLVGDRKARDTESFSWQLLVAGHTAPRGAKKEEAFGGVILKSERPSGALFTNSGPPFFTVESKIEVLSPLGTSFH